MKPRVLVCDTVHEDGITMLEEAGMQVELDTSITQSELLKKIPKYDAIIVRSRTKVTKGAIQAGTNLKFIARAGVGLDNIDLQAAKEKNITVVNSPEAPSNAVAELVVAHMFSLARNIPKADAAMKQGQWLKKQLTGIEIAGKTLGIIGFGRIGYNIAKKAKALGMKIEVYDIAIDKRMEYIKELDAEAVTTEELIATSDFITVHVPLLPTTRDMINTDQFNTMKDNSYIINTARGGIINEEALVKALKTGKLAGAALDVYVDEPPRSTELIGQDNIICTPHLGASTIEAQRANATICAEKLIQHFSLYVKSS